MLQLPVLRLSWPSHPREKSFLCECCFPLGWQGGTGTARWFSRAEGHGRAGLVKDMAPQVTEEPVVKVFVSLTLSPIFTCSTPCLSLLCLRLLWCSLNPHRNWFKEWTESLTGLIWEIQLAAEAGTWQISGRGWTVQLWAGTGKKRNAEKRDSLLFQLCPNTAAIETASTVWAERLIQDRALDPGGFGGDGMQDI